MRDDSDIVVVWSGRDSLIPERAERWDSRFAGMPSFDLEEGEANHREVEKARPKRKYNRTGQHKGVFSRTNPAAAHYKPTIRRDGEVTNNE